MLATGEVVGELVELDQPEGGGQLGRLEVPAVLVEDEEVVVLEAVVDGAEEPVAALALLGAVDLELGAAAPPADCPTPTG